MSLASLGIDVYQLTTLIAHAAEDRLGGDSGATQQVGMSFFFRKLPNKRNYVVAAGLRSILDHCAGLHLSPDELHTLTTHPILGPAFATPPGKEVLSALQRLSGFQGDIDALPEGTLAYAGPARRTGGEPARIGTAPVCAYTPLLQVRTDLCTAKLIETPWLCRLNHQSMVASKAARVASAANDERPAGAPERVVIEFGQRRTHADAAVDAAYAAYLGGCHATSNLAATHRHGIPSVGTMDHFAIQAAERLGVPVGQTERGFFATFCRLFPGAATLLVDTYDSWQGIRNAVSATAGAVTGVRLDSEVTPESVRRARALLDELHARHVQIFVSDGLDEWRVRDLARAGATGFGVGENITCVPDAATGIGAVGKLVVNGYGKPTMKLARGSGKATLPGMLAAYRFADHDLLALHDEPAPAGGRPLLQPIWRGAARVADLPPPAQSRAYVREQIAALPAHLRALEVDAERPFAIVLSDALYQLVEKLVLEATLAEGPAQEIEVRS